MANTPGWSPAFDTDRPAGRWARILRAAASARAPLALGDLKRVARRAESATRPDREKFKTLRAVRSLVDQGLLVRTADGFITTAAGLRMLADCRPRTPAEDAIIAAVLAALADPAQPERTAA